MQQERVADSDVKVQDLATLVASLNRFLVRLSSMQPFEEAQLGLAEWLALSIILRKSGINNRQLANILGVSPQRINQITESLKKLGLISVSSSQDDARKKIISITRDGTARLQQLNAALTPKIEAVIGNRPRLLGRINRMIVGTLMQIVAPRQADRPARRGENRAVAK